MPAGRPEANINWDEVDKLLEAGCLVTEVAANFGICRDTFYKRCKTDNNIDFSTYVEQKKSKGESLLRKVQFDKALDGDNLMLIWLGKQRLEQTDKQQIKQEIRTLSDIEGWTTQQKLTHKDHEEPEQANQAEAEEVVQDNRSEADPF